MRLKKKSDQRFLYKRSGKFAPLYKYEINVLSHAINSRGSEEFSLFLNMFDVYKENIKYVAIVACSEEYR